MSDLLSHLADLLKLAPRYFAPIGLVAGAVLFLPANWLEQIGIGALTKEQRLAVGLAFLFCAAVLVIAGARWFWRPFGRGIARRRFQRRLQDRLQRLTEDEKQVLRYYFAKETRTNYLRINDGIVQSLSSAGIIYRASAMGDLVDGFAFNITEPAWEFLIGNLGLLEGTTNLYRTDKRERDW